MRDKLKILLASSNPGKLKEMQDFFKTQHFDFLTLADLDKTILEPEETGTTIYTNAFEKAKYYAEASGLMTIADDTGLFIDALDGWPGIHVGRILKTDDENFGIMLGKMEGIKDRTAAFRCRTVVYDPDKHTAFHGYGECAGKIATEPGEKGENKWGYNRIFIASEINKNFGSITMQEKYQISHRSKSLTQIKYYLHNQYGSTQFVVPAALIIKDGKILMNLRNDPQNKEVHNTWEFPGGGVDFGEDTRQALLREAKEETGYDLEIVQLLQHIQTEEWIRQQGKIHYQLHIIPYVCKIVGGELNANDEEVLDSKWFELDDILNQKLIGNNDKMVKIFLPELKEIIKENNL